MEQQSTTRILPENAYKELKEGEVYRPVMDPVADTPETTPYSILWDWPWRCCSQPRPLTRD